MTEHIPSKYPYLNLKKKMGEREIIPKFTIYIYIYIYKKTRPKIATKNKGETKQQKRATDLQNIFNRSQINGDDPGYLL